MMFGNMVEYHDDYLDEDYVCIYYPGGGYRVFHCVGQGGMGTRDGAEEAVSKTIERWKESRRVIVEVCQFCDNKSIKTKPQ